MEKQDKKALKRYELMLNIRDISSGNSLKIKNYSKFMGEFDAGEFNDIPEKESLVRIDGFTTKYYNNAEEFNDCHRNFFNSNEFRDRFYLLTTLNPEDCIFSLYLTYKMDGELKKLRVAYGENECIKNFSSKHKYHPQTEYSINDILSISWNFYRKIIDDNEFYEFAVEKFKRYHAYSYLLEQIETCRERFQQKNEKFNFLILDNLRRYKSLRAAAMVMVEYDKRNTIENNKIR